MKPLSKVDVALLGLVRAGLWEKPLDSAGLSELSPEEWKDLLSSARRQAVSGLVYAGINQIADDSSEPPYQLLVPLVAEIDANEAEYSSMASVIEDLYREFEKMSVRPVLVKGHSIANLYKNPHLRSCGDIDLYFNRGDFEIAVPKNAEKASDGSCNYTRAGMIVEYHRQLLDINRGSKKKIIDRLIDRYGFVDTFLYRATSPMLTLLLLDSHILKHSIGRGVGLKQFCDFAVAYSSLDFDRSEFESACRELGIWKWTRLLLSFCSDHLGLDCGCDQCMGADRLLARVMEGGNFGFFSGKRTGVTGTFLSFVSNLGFSLRVAPLETLSTIMSLARGRMSIGK